MTISKTTIEKIKDAEVSVSLWNRCFNRAVVRVELSKSVYELIAEVTHPFLEWQCGKKDKIELIRWKGYRGNPIEIPIELSSKIQEMILKATMKDDYAQQLSNENLKAFKEDFKEMGLRL